MPRMEIDIDVPAFLQSQLEEAPEQLQGYFLQFEDLWERKLWKQLTDLLVEFYAIPESKPYRMPLYNSFTNTFAKHINQLKLVSFGIAASNEYDNQEEALSFMESLSKQVDHPASKDAFVFATIESARIKLLLGDVAGAQEATQKAGKTLDEFDAVDTIIHAAYYRVSADYHKAKAEYTSYYRNALLYLACVKTEDLPLPEAQERAYDLSIAALLGDTIYNFGELLLHPILESLENTEHAWLKDFLMALNSGDLVKFESLLGNLSKQPLLEQSLSFLRQKICLMSLIETIFKRPAHDRILPFHTIATETRLPVFEVEHLIMKALSLKLIKGSIDQVDSTVTITWVQPRVLNMQQIGSMHGRLLEWSADVKKLETHMHSNASSFIQVS